MRATNEKPDIARIAVTRKRTADVVPPSANAHVINTLVVDENLDRRE